jgi:mono/diheme cytochrome c family protein
VIADGRPGTPMPPFDKAKGGQLDTAQLQALVHGLKQTWMGAAGSANPPPYSATSVGDAARGVKIFASACAGCHGPDGKGGLFKERPIGSINDASFLTLTSDQVLRRYIITGRPDLEMPSFQERTGRSPSFEPLSAQDVSDLTALLVSWRKPLAKH